MRILIVNVHFAPDSFGGATLVAEETARRLHDRGHDVAIFTSTQDTRVAGNEFYRYEQWGIPVVALRTFHGDVYDEPTIKAQFGRVLDAFQPDVVHFHAVQTFGVGVVSAAQARDIPTVVTLHDAWWLCERQFMVRQNGQFCGQTAISPTVCATCVPDAAAHVIRQQTSLELLNGCDRVLAPSDFWCELMVDSGVSAERAFTNTNGVSRPRTDWQRSTRFGPARLGFVGGLNPIKGGPQLIAALQQLKRSDYELLAVDSFVNLGRHSISAVDWPVPGLVRIVPGYNHDTIDDFFDGIDVLLFPSQWRESYGLTVREAALRGVWSILPDGGGTEEHIIDGRNGTVYDRSGGQTALMTAVNHYLDHYAALRPDPDLAARIPTYDQQVDDLVRHLTAAIEGHGKARP